MKFDNQIKQISNRIAMKYKFVYRNRTNIIDKTLSKILSSIIG